MLHFQRHLLNFSTFLILIPGGNRYKDVKVPPAFHCWWKEIVFICSLDAQCAFDHIPHSVIFSKLDGVLPDHVWRLLYRWYSSMYVTVRLNGSLGRRLRVERGVRQGSITSPWMFNLVYQELLQRVNEMNCGITIGDKHFNIFCYADDKF